MPLFQIKHRVTGLVLFEKTADSLKLCVKAAVEARTDLNGADLGGADLNGADLGGAYLGGAYLGGADLNGADLNGAYLGGADLNGADLGGADLGGADLGGAYLGGAYLIDAGQDSRGYRFVGFLRGDAVRIIAGCRDFTLAEAEVHWVKTHDNDSALKAECLAKVALIETVASARGWIEAKQKAA